MDEDNSLSINQQRIIDPLAQEIEQFSKSLKNTFESRSNELYSMDKMETLVEGSINYLQTKGWISDPDPESFIDSVETTLMMPLTDQFTIKTDRPKQNMSFFTL